MYQLDPFTRLISGLIVTELHDLEVRCSKYSTSALVVRQQSKYFVSNFRFLYQNLKNSVSSILQAASNVSHMLRVMSAQLVVISTTQMLLSHASTAPTHPVTISTNPSVSASMIAGEIWESSLPSLHLT